MDDIERGQEREQQFRAQAIAAVRATPLLYPTGTCHWCEASVPEGAHFCDIDCRSDWEREQAARKRNGMTLSGGAA